MFYINNNYKDEDVELESVWGAKSLQDVLAHVSNENRRWCPPGRQVAVYEQGEDRFQVWLGKFSDERMRAYHQRMRPFMIWFVDGARFLDDKDEVRKKRVEKSR